MTGIKLWSDLAFVATMIAGPCLGAKWGKTGKISWGASTILVLAANITIQLACLAALLKR